MIRLFKFAVILLFSFWGSVNQSLAYEFAKVNDFLDMLMTEYSGNLDLMMISLKGGEALTKFDKSLRLYHSDSKAFLYKQNNLVSIFDLPPDENPDLWRSVLKDILETGTEYSAELTNKTDDLEDEVVDIISHNLGEYSRIERSSSQKRPFLFDIKKNILYVSFGTFYSGFTAKLEKTILENPHIDGLILDLRENTGGNFNEALKTADLFLDNLLITYSLTSNNDKKFFISQSGDILQGKPIAVLTNEHTASAAEIVVAALGEQNRAIHIGTKTFGKGSIQKIRRFYEKTLYLADGHFYSPSGKEINNQGIIPQICTGINGSCQYSDKGDLTKDILMAIHKIKKNLG